MMSQKHPAMFVLGIYYQLQTWLDFSPHRHSARHAQSIVDIEEVGHRL
jgi:hypothetical protein